MKTSELRRRLTQSNAARGQLSGPAVEAGKPLTVHHAHCKDFMYLRVEPPPANGITRFNREQYVATIGEMQKVLAAFDASGGLLRSVSTKGSTEQ